MTDWLSIICMFGMCICGGVLLQCFTIVQMRNLIWVERVEELRRQLAESKNFYVSYDNIKRGY